MAAPRSRFFTVMAVLALCVAFAGFAGTYFAPVATGRFSAPIIVHLHGLLLFAWLTTFLVQSQLIHRRNLRLHKRLGWAACALALGVTLSTIMVGVWSTHRDIAAGGEDTAVSALVGTVTSAIIFLALVAAGVIWRRDGASHKRLMLLATLAILWPAWFRFRHFLPFVPAPEITLAIAAADSLILACLLRDWLVERRIHPVFLWVGPAIIAEHIVEAALFDSPSWRAFAHALYAALSPLSFQ